MTSDSIDAIPILLPAALAAAEAKKFAATKKHEIKKIMRFKKV